MSVIGNEKAMVGSNRAEDAQPSPMFQKQKSTSRRENKAPHSTRTCSFGLPIRKGFSTVNYLKSLGGKIVGVLKMMSPRGASPKVTSSERAKPGVDSQRAQAIDDCVQFMNSSSSLSRVRKKVGRGSKEDV